MTYGCRMDECSWFKEKSRALVLRNSDGELIRFTTLEGASRHPDDRYPTHYTPRLHVRFKEVTSYVFCSHSRPSVAFHVDDGPNGAEWLAHMLDLYDLFGYNSSSAVTYLLACHGIYQHGQTLSDVARHLGYHRGTPNIQIELRKPSDLADRAFVARAIKEAERQ